MYMKIKDILNSRNVLIKLNNTSGISSIAAFYIGKNIKLLDEDLKLYNDVRIKILENSANKDEDGVPIINESTLQYDISDDKLQIALEEIEELQDEDINIDIRKVTVEDINKAELTPRELMSIEFMLEV